MRVLIVGWPSFRYGEATAGDVASMERVGAALGRAEIPYDLAWSPVFRPGGLSLEDAAAHHYTDVVFVCGPVHGWQVEELHDRYQSCHRIAIGVSVIDPESPAHTGFDAVLARDEPGKPPVRDLAAGVRYGGTPVAAVVLAPGQREYGRHRRHDVVHRNLLNWLQRTDCAPMILDSRLDTRNARLCSTPNQFTSLIARSDVVVTTRLHGLAFAMAQGVPAIAVDTVSGGGKVTAQAQAWEWPAVLSAEQVRDSDDQAHSLLQRWWDWCRSAEADELAASRAVESPAAGQRAMSDLLDRLRTRASSTESV